MNVDETTFNGFVRLIERLDFKVSIEHIDIMPEEQIVKFKIIYIVLFSLWKNSYDVFLNKLSREKLINKLSKTEEKLGKIKDITEEKVGEHLLYFYKCLKNDFDARS